MGHDATNLPTVDPNIMGHSSVTYILVNKIVGSTALLKTSKSSLRCFRYFGVPHIFSAGVWMSRVKPIFRENPSRPVGNIFRSSRY